MGERTEEDSTSTSEAPSYPAARAIVVLSRTAPRNTVSNEVRHCSSVA